MAEASVKRGDLVAVEGGHAVKLTSGPHAGKFLSIQLDGSLQVRDSAGPWETGQVEGQVWTVYDPNYPTGAYSLYIAG